MGERPNRMPPLSSDLFDYALPAGRIARHPAPRRDQSRLMVVDRASRTVFHRRFADLPSFLRPGDILIRNNAAVLPARLHLRRATGGQVECLLLAPVERAALAGGESAGRGTTGAEGPVADTGGGPAGGSPATGGELWRCLIRPGRRLPVGAQFGDEAGTIRAEVVAKDESGVATLRLWTTEAGGVAAAAARMGDVPLPPYLEREADAGDRERYQTVYADRSRSVAVAAPTAGLHFTPELLESLGAMGVRSADVTLHVGLGTFKPISAATIEEHAIHREVYEVPAATQALLRSPGAGRRVAVGTTAVRSIEDFLAKEGTREGLPGWHGPGGREAAPGGEVGRGGDAAAARDQPWIAEAGLFIHPPRSFRGVDALVTNFHQPRSTLLCLVAAFLAPGSTDGIAWLRELYAEALHGDYRFLSYGDAMLIL